MQGSAGQRAPWGATAGRAKCLEKIEASHPRWRGARGSLQLWIAAAEAGTLGRGRSHRVGPSAHRPRPKQPSAALPKASSPAAPSGLSASAGGDTGAEQAPRPNGCSCGSSSAPPSPPPRPCKASTWHVQAWSGGGQRRPTGSVLGHARGAACRVQPRGPSGHSRAAAGGGAAPRAQQP